MRGVAQAAALALAVACTGTARAETSLKDFLPDFDDLREQAVSRSGGDSEWPFSVERGTLSCMWIFGQRRTFFIEDAEPGPKRRALELSANPFVLLWGNAVHLDLFAVGLTDEQKIVRTAPYLAIAERLCEQPAGTNLPDGAL